MANLPEPYHFWDAHCAEQERELKRRPICTYCEEPIQGDYLIEFNGKLICEHCFDAWHRKPIEDYLE